MSDVEVARPLDEVFGNVTDPSRFGEWQSGVVSGHIEPEGPPMVVRQARTEVPQSCQNLKKRLES